MARQIGLTLSTVEDEVAAVGAGQSAQQVAAQIASSPLASTVQSLDARTDVLEEVDDVLRSRFPILTNHRVVVSSRNTAISLGQTLGLTGADEELIAVVKTTGEPDGRTAFKRSALIASGTVIADGRSLTAANGIEWTNPPDDRRYRLGIDSTGDLFFASDTGDTYFITLDRYVVDTTPQLRFSASGDVALSRDSGGALQGDLRNDAVESANLSSTVRTSINDKAIAGAFDYDTGTGLLTVIDGAGSSGNDVNIPRPTKAEVYAHEKTTLVAGSHVTLDHDDIADTVTINATSSRGTGTSTDLLPTALPLADPTSLSVGLIRNYAGTEYVVIAGTDRPNQHHLVVGVAGTGPSGGNYRGDAIFEFENVDPGNIRFRPLKTGVSSTPTTIYAVYQDTDGQRVEFAFGRAPGSDSTTRYAYNKMPGEPSIGGDSATTASISVFTDLNRTTPFNFQPASKRWIPLHLPDTDVDPVALKGNADKWPKAKLPDDTAYGDIGIETVWVGTAVQFAALSRAAGNKTLYLVT